MPPSLRLSLASRSVKELVGLDIQPGLIAAVEARSNGSVVAERAIGAPLHPDIMREGDVLDPAALSESLKQLFHGSRLGKRVRVGVANQRTVMRTLELPPVTDSKELAAAVRFQAQDQVPMPLANAVLDFHPLGIIDTPAGPRQRVVLVAAQRDMVERLLAAVRGAGLTPIAVDMAAFALIRSLYRSYAADGERVLYLNVDGLTNVAIAEGATCRFTRVLGGGIEELASQLAEQRSIAREEARRLLAEVDLTQPAAGGQPQAAPAPASAPAPAVPTPDPVRGLAPEAAPELGAVVPVESQSQVTPQPQAGGDPHADLDAAPVESERAHGYAQELAALGESTVAGQARALLESGVRTIAGEVRNSLDFHRAQEGGAEVARVVLSGGALDIPGFTEALQSALGVDVRAETVGVAGEGVVHGVSAQRLAVATGLAVSEVSR
jgi:type IV pilus assembly protein PilM